MRTPKKENLLNASGITKHSDAFTGEKTDVPVFT